MVLLASNKCDLMINYSEWLFQRLLSCRICRSNKSGKDVALDYSTQDVDCLVFKTRNPIPLLNKTSSLNYLGYKSLFDIYLSPYDETIEKNIGKKREILNATIKLSKKVGSDKIYWHYSPLFFSDKYGVEFHKKSFISLCKALNGYCNTVVVDTLKPTYKTNVQLISIPDKEKAELIKFMIKSAYNMGFNVIVNFDEQGEKRDYFSKIINETYGLDVSKRKFVDLGIENSCLGNCEYCSKRDYYKANKIAETHNPKNLRLDGLSTLSSTPTRKHKTSKGNPEQILLG